MKMPSIFLKQLEDPNQSANRETNAEAQTQKAWQALTNCYEQEHPGLKQSNKARTSNLPSRWEQAQALGAATSRIKAARSEVPSGITLP
jgi:hypothetical protein